MRMTHHNHVYASPAIPDAERARLLGYGEGPDAIAAMRRTHDAYHAVAAHLLGLPSSPTLHWVASGELTHPTRHEDAVGCEEDLVLDLQRWMQTGEYGGTMRLLWLLGHDPEEVKAALRVGV